MDEQPKVDEAKLETGPTAPVEAPTEPETPSPVEPTPEPAPEEPVEPAPADEDPLPTKTEIEEEPVPVDAQVYLKGKAVIEVRTRIQNGRFYKEVVTVDATTLMSEEDFAATVTTDPTK